jgi:hypothetical protein
MVEKNARPNSRHARHHTSDLIDELHRSHGVNVLPAIKYIVKFIMKRTVLCEIAWNAGKQVQAVSGLVQKILQVIHLGHM